MERVVKEQGLLRGARTHACKKRKGLASSRATDCTHVTKCECVTDHLRRSSWISYDRMPKSHCGCGGRASPDATFICKRNRTRQICRASLVTTLSLRPQRGNGGKR